MIIHNCTQGSQEWLKLRSGIPTASSFHRVITPKKRERSTQIEQYARELAAERLLGRPLETFASAEMTDGTEREEQAIASYELTHGVDTWAVGFLTTDDGKVGASPDRMCEGWLLEAKNPKIATHIGYLLGEGPDDDYRCQLQGQLYVAEKDRVDIISCYPGLPDKVVFVGRDEDFIGKLKVHLDYLNETVELMMEKLAALGYLPAEPLPPLPEVTDPLMAGLGITDEDLASYMADIAKQQGWTTEALQ
jgi:hypothetical protein